MTLSKAGEPIRSLDDWYRLAPPKSRHHWVPGRSAQELARAWLGEQMPHEVVTLFRAHPDLGPIAAWTAEPEVRLRFDDYGGETRNSDLVVDASDQHGPFLIAVEGKADEPFSDTVAKTLAACRKRLLTNPRSNGVARVERLSQWLFGEHNLGVAAVDSLRYQLLTATAGAIREAERRRYARAVLLVHEFLTSKTTPHKVARNAEDLSAFVNHLSVGVFAAISSGELLGPVTQRHGPVRLYIAKASRIVKAEPSRA